MTIRGHLRSVYRRESEDGNGRFDVHVELIDDLLRDGDRLGMCIGSPMRPTRSSAVEVVESLGSRLLLRPDPVELVEGEHLWTVSDLLPESAASHANDGPVSAWIERSDGTAIELDVPHTELLPPPADASSPTSPSAGHPAHGLLPRVATIVCDGPLRYGAGVTLVNDPEDRWPAVAILAKRLGSDVVGGRPLLGLDATVTSDLTDGAYELHIDRTDVRLRAASPTALTHGMVTLAQLVVSGVPERLEISDAPRHRRRGLSVDLARRWFEPGVVERLVDLAAWRKLSHIQLHLTDDEAWRVPVESYPSLGEIGGVRGYGLAIGPLCGSDAAPYGRAYTSAEIGRWVERAKGLGVELVPEIDIPGHCYAALVAVPELRDPNDRSGARSVQGFRDNVLIPGPATTRFLQEAFGSLADLFPYSPVLHLGGDEVPPTAWTRSPRAAEYGAEHGIEPGPEMAAALIAEAAAAIGAAGRAWAGWQEVARFDHAVEPAYVVAWKSTSDVDKLLESGHRVVASPADAFYLDMAVDDAWATPGASWAGVTPMSTTCALELPVSDDTKGQLLGGQAAIWAEHVGSVEILDELLFPRLDAVAEITWAGTSVGRTDDISGRSLSHPTLLRQTLPFAGEVTQT